MIDEMKAISHARMEMDRVASANGSPRMLLGRKLAIVTSGFELLRDQRWMKMCTSVAIDREAETGYGVDEGLTGPETVMARVGGARQPCTEYMGCLVVDGDAMLSRRPRMDAWSSVANAMSNSTTSSFRRSPTWIVKKTGRYIVVRV